MSQTEEGSAALFVVKTAMETTRENPEHWETTRCMLQAMMRTLGSVHGTHDIAYATLHTALQFMNKLEMADDKQYAETGNSFLGKRKADWPGK